MQFTEFNNQMNRLISTFGKNAYGDERLQLIWREVKDHSYPWFIDAIDDFIGNHRLPPLMSDFSNKIADERERLWRIEKRQHAEESTALGTFWGTFTDIQIKNTCEDIRAMIMRSKYEATQD